MKVDNYSGEAGAFNWSASTTSWVNITNTNQSMLKSLNYTNTHDEAELDIRLEVPYSEPPGVKKSFIFFTWEESPPAP